jgi:hypothetical protein
MNFRPLLRALLLMAPFALLASAPETKVTVSVKNQFDKPVDNAAVILDFLGSRQIVKLGKRKPVHWEVHTNLEGIASFPPVPQGTIQLQVIKKDYQTFGDKFDVDTEEKKVDIKLNPPQKQYSAHPPLKPADTQPPPQ